MSNQLTPLPFNMFSPKPSECPPNPIVNCPEVGTFLNGYELVKRLGYGAFGAAYKVRDPNGREEVMKISLQKRTDDNSFNMEVQVLERLKHFSGFPQASCNFIDGTMRCLVMSNAGMTVYDVFKPNNTTRSCTTRNVLRLAYQICTLVQKLHNAGFYHRDLHEGNVMLKLNRKGVLKATIIDFGQSKEINKAMEPDSCNLKSWFSSLYVYSKMPFEAADDYISIIYLLASCLGESPIGSEEAFWAKEKLEFHTDPASKIKKPANIWLAQLYFVVELQRGYQFDLEKCLDVLRNVIPGFDITSDLKYYTKRGNPYCR